MAISQFVFFFTLIFFSKSLCLSFPHDDALKTQTGPSVHELLPKFGFPKGLLPDVVKSYSLSDAGRFEVELERPCYVYFTDLVYYDKKINGNLRFGVMSDVSGIQTKKPFVWIPVTGIHASDGVIEIQAGLLSEKLPSTLFENIPTCRSKPYLRVR